MKLQFLVTYYHNVLIEGGKHRICYINDENSVSEKTMRSTGDYVRKDEIGNLWYIGRDDYQIKRQGKRINLQSIREVNQHFMSTCNFVEIHFYDSLFVNT